MNRYSVLAILIAIIIGVLIGWFGKTTQSNKETLKLIEQVKREAQQKIDSAEVNILQLNNSILQLKAERSQDSITIVSVKSKLEKKEGLLKVELEKNKYRTTDEKVTFILDRYSN